MKKYQIKLETIYTTPHQIINFTHHSKLKSFSLLLTVLINPVMAQVQGKAESVAKAATSVEIKPAVTTRADALATSTQAPSTITVVQKETMTVPVEQQHTRATLGSSSENAVWRDIPISGSDI